MFNLSWLLPLFAVGLIISCLAPLLTKKIGHHARFLVLVVPLAFTLFSGLGVASLGEGQEGILHIPWVSFLNLGLSFSFDGLSLLFCLLISSFGLLIIFYASEYLKGHPDLGKFYLYILIFMLSMIGLVLSDHLLLLFIFWELTTFSSFLLIGFEHDKEFSRASAWQAILITTLGGLAMMAGFLLLGSICGTFRISEIVQMGDFIRGSEYYLAILILILLGAFTKSAQFPFYFWLPGAMAAPTPVSAYLHSATMVKAGIYLLARLSPALAGTAAWTDIVSSVGAITMIVGAVLACKQDDLKLLLAYMTVMALGTLTLLLGLGSVEAIKAAVFFLLVHSFYKGAMFLVTGAIDHGAHTRKISELGGLLKVMPWTAAAAIISLISMGGLPPAIGFIGKEMIYKATLVRSDLFSLVVIVLSVLAMGISTALAAVFFFKVFLGERRQASMEAHENSWVLWAPPLLLGVCGFALGIFPSWMQSTLMTSAVSAIKGENVTTALFAGVKFDQALLLSVISTALGVVLYLFAERVRNTLTDLAPFFKTFSPENIYTQGMQGLLKLAGWQTHLLQRGYQMKYLNVVFLTIILATGASLLSSSDKLSRSFEMPVLDLYEWIVSGLIVVAALASLFSRTMISAVLLLGVVGYGVAILFVVYGAPDLALTQILIETLTIILIALIGIKFPFAFSDKELKRNLLGKGVVSIAFGALMTLILWNVMSHPFDPYLSEFFAENSYSIGHGRNIVNVILVDFRAFDTLGEITVLAIGSLGFYSLIKMARGSEESK